jgi:hypothetical protein
LTGNTKIIYLINLLKLAVTKLSKIYTSLVQKNAFITLKTHKDLTKVNFLFTKAHKYSSKQA